MSAQPEERSAVGPDGIVHQALRREVNERINSLDTKTFRIEGRETIDVVCECVRAKCAAHVTMTLAEYEMVRRFPTRFVVKEGHEVAEEERVVADSDGYVVIEARGRGGLYAVGADPRSSYRRRDEVGA